MSASFWLGQNERSDSNADACYEDGCVWLGQKSSFNAECDAAAHYDDDCVWLGPKGFFDSSSDAAARFSDGYIWLGQNLDPMTRHADACYENGYVWLGHTKNPMTRHADARYDGDDDGAAAAAVLLLLSDGGSSSETDSDDEESDSGSGSSSSDYDSGSSYSSSYVPSSSASSSSSPDFSVLWAILIIVAILIGIGSLGDITKMFNPPTRNESYTPPARSEYPASTTRKAPEQTRTESLPSANEQPEQFFTLGSTIEEVKKVQGEPTQPTFWYKNADTTYLSYGDDGSARVWFFQGRVSSWTSYPRSPLKARIVPSGPVDQALAYFTVGSTMDEVLFVQGQPFSISISEIKWPNRTKAEEESGAPTIKTSWEYGFKSKVLFRGGKVTHWEQDDEILCWKSTGPIVLKVNPQ